MATADAVWRCVDFTVGTSQTLISSTRDSPSPGSAAFDGSLDPAFHGR